MPLVLVTFLFAPFTFGASEISQYDQVKSEMLENEKASREFMAKLYDINSRMKSLSKRRNIINNRVINSEANVRNLARNTAELESTIKNQRVKLSKRLRALYMLGDDKLIRAIFTAKNSEDLQQVMKYLKIFTERDYHLVKSYESNLKILSRKRTRLERNVAKLIQLRKRLDTQEQRLTDDQNTKKEYIDKLSAKKQEALRRMSRLKRSVTTDVFNLDFFENKGSLRKPFLGALKQEFGMIENPRYGYRLIHKGHFYQSVNTLQVVPVAKGKVVFKGRIDGYGQTVVLDHGDHYYTVYSGLENSTVKQGQFLAMNDAISPKEKNLYFEIRHFSDAVDPKVWLKD